MYYIPFLGALALGAGTILEKIVLRKRKIDIKLYQTASFLAITLTILPFIYFFWRLDSLAWEMKNIFIFALVILFSLAANMFTFYSMKWEKISNIEPAKILEPLFVILLAIIFSYIFGQTLFEKNPKIIISALIAGLALVLSHIRKHHLKFNKYFLAAIAGSFFFALELVVSRLILNFYSPIAFYFLRCLAIFLISLIIFRSKFSNLNSRVKWEILITGAIWSLYRIIVYYGYINIGVIFTTLMVMLGPVFIYLFAWKFLKEKLDWRNITAAIIIVGSVLYAVLG